MLSNMVTFILLFELRKTAMSRFIMITVLVYNVQMLNKVTHNFINIQYSHLYITF